MENLADVHIKQLGIILLVGFHILCAEDHLRAEINKAALLLQTKTNEIKHKTRSGQQIGAFVNSDDRREGYWIGIQVDEFDHVPEGMETLKIPTQTYATIIHESDPNTANTYRKLHQWISAHNINRKPNHWNVEKYRCAPGADELVIELMETIEGEKNEKANYFDEESL